METMETMETLVHELIQFFGADNIKQVDNKIIKIRPLWHDFVSVPLKVEMIDAVQSFFETHGSKYVYKIVACLEEMYFKVWFGRRYGNELCILSIHRGPNF